jgi:hypothetical protein
LAHAPDAISEGPGCVYLYPDEQKLANAVANGHEFPETGVRRVSDQEIRSADFEDVRRLVPEGRYAIISPEVAFDAEKLMSSLAFQASIRGVRFMNTSSLTDLDLVQTSDGWTLRESGDEIVKSQIVVYAAGILNGFIAGRLLPMHGDKALVTALKDAINKTLIVILHSSALGRILCLQELEDVAYVAAMPVGGALSLTFGAPAPRRVEHPSDADVPSDPDLLRVLARAIVNAMPGLEKRLPIPAHFYMCQKIDKVDHPLNNFTGKEFGMRYFSWIEPTRLPKVFFYTPGKWTIASVAAKSFADCLERGSVRRRDSVNKAAVGCAAPPPMF